MESSSSEVQSSRKPAGARSDVHPTSSVFRPATRTDGGLSVLGDVYAIPERQAKSGPRLEEYARSSTSRIKQQVRAKTLDQDGQRHQKSKSKKATYAYWRAATANVRTLTEQHDVSKLPHILNQMNECTKRKYLYELRNKFVFE